MSVLTAPAAPRTSSLVVGGLVATVVASVATSAVAALGLAAGISLDVSGGAIPVSGFATLTAIFSVIGLLIALVLSRTARSPRTAFVRTTVVLTALSLVPDVLVEATTATKLLLMVTHLVAAAVVVPVIARRLAV